MASLFYFLLAVTLLVAVHEYGHYRVAVACGVRVERFSIGLGPVLLRWRQKRSQPGQDTEFVLSAFPLGGYVRMLDETAEVVPPHLREMAFNRQSVGRRALIVLAGPLANLILAWVLLAVVAMAGQYQPRPIASAPVPGSALHQAGLQSGDAFLSLRADQEETPVQTLDEWVRQMALAQDQGAVLSMRVQGQDGQERWLRMTWPTIAVSLDTPEGLRSLGWTGVWSPPILGSLVEGGQAVHQGLMAGDRVLSIDGQPVRDAQQLRQLIRTSIHPDGTPMVRLWRIERAQQAEPMTLQVQPRVLIEQGQTIGRLDVQVGGAPSRIWVRHDFFSALTQAAQRSWEMAWATLTALGQMLTGMSSWDQLAGPVTMADFAGQSASLGWTHYVQYLAWISLSLGILNLLPIPVLDGGHLMCYLYESVRGRPVPPSFMSFLQRLGLLLVALLMFTALYNDLMRWWGQG